MTQNALPRNPLRNYQFRVGFLDPTIAASASQGSGSGGSVIGGTYVAGVKRVSGLNLSIAAHETWSGGNNLHRYANPNRVTWDPIRLEQGLALSSELEDWAKAALDFLHNGCWPGVPLKRNVFIDIWDPYVHIPAASGGEDHSPGDCLRRYLVFNAWVSRYQALPQLDSMSNEVALLSVELIHEGWRVAEPGELPVGFRRLEPRRVPVAGAEWNWT
jgi:phage tail-like protein